MLKDRTNQKGRDGATEEPSSAVPATPQVIPPGNSRRARITRSVARRDRCARVSRRRSRQLDQLQSLLGAGQAIVSSLAIEDVLDRVLAGVCHLFHASAAVVLHLTPSGVLRPLSSFGLSKQYLECVSDLPLGVGVTGVATREHRVIAVSDVREHPFEKIRALHPAESIRSFASAPLIVRGRAIGALNVYWRCVRDLAESEQNLLLGFANQAAAGIENARLYAEAERSLAEISAQKETLAGIVRNAQDGIVVVDHEMRVLVFSPAAERITGWAASDVVGHHCHEFLRCHQSGQEALCDSACPMRPLIDFTKDGVPYGEFLVNTQEGGERWIGATWAPTRIGANGQSGAVMILRDITAAKQVDRMKSAIISLVSHELRTPLTSIRALSELLTEHEFEPAEARQLMQTLSREAQRMDRLIGNILDIARYQGGRLPYHPQPVELGRLVHQAVDLLRGQAPKHRFIVRMPPDLPIINADPDRLRQVLDNLLVNAVKYSPEGGHILVDVQLGTPESLTLPVLTADGKSRAAGPRPGQQEIAVSIRDEGVGIPREQLVRIFDPFHRVDTSDACKVSGTGLGLHIARSLVELHGGRIWAESAGPGRGATFTFTLPVPEQ